MTITIEIGGKIIAKARARTVSKGGKTWSFTPQKTEDFQNYVELLTKAQIKRPIQGAVKVDIIVNKKPPKSWSKKKKNKAISGEILATAKPDVDNYAKGILDAMNKIAFLDDSYIVDLRVRKEYGKKDGAMVRIEQVPGSLAY